jgi:protein-S-isoprenylcysteine O-methyltransferase Ste14
MVGFGVPIIWLWLTDGFQLVQPPGFVLIGVGLVGLVWCVRDFYITGSGTLAPWAPPEKLVVVGLYRYSRNPMYISVVLVLWGWAISFCSIGLFIYSLFMLAAFHLRVVHYEEPRLAKQFGEAWERYSSRVPRWLW